MRFPLNRQARAGIYTTLTIAALATSGRDAQAQTARSNPKPISTQAAAKNQADAQQQVDPNAPKLKSTRIPSSPNDPVAIVNNQVITRQQLAEEAIARKGEEILDTLIARVMIDQALKSKGIAVTADEVNAEIEAMAQPHGRPFSGRLAENTRQRAEHQPDPICPRHYLSIAGLEEAGRITRAGDRHRNH